MTTKEQLYLNELGDKREIAALREEIARLRDALEDLVKWSEAYPTDIFIEPDYAKAHEILQASGGTLDAVSAGIMRRATIMVGERARAALKGNGEGL